MITATFTARLRAELGDEPDGGRTIRGTAVPWNQEGTVTGGQRVKFLPGSLDASGRPTVRLGHDGPPIGKVQAATSTDTGLDTTVKVSKTQDGDEALVLAADGVLGMFSVGVDPTAYDFDGDVMVVQAADWHHLALLDVGAFADALVTEVAASKGEPVSDTTVTTDPPAPVVEAAPPAPVPVPLNRYRNIGNELTLARLAEIIAAENRGELQMGASKAAINAALADLTTSTGAGAVQPAFINQVRSVVDHGRPLINAISRGALPSSGASIEFPKWAVPPVVGTQSAEKAAVPSASATIDVGTAPVITWAGAHDISIQLAERSSPSFMAAYLEAMAASYAKQSDTYVATTLLAAAGAATLPGTPTFVSNVAALFAKLDPATTPAGPLFLGMGWVAWQSMIATTTANGPAFWSGSVNLGDMLPGVSGVGSMFLDPNLPTDMMLLGSVNGATFYESAGAPVDVRVMDTEKLGINVAVYGFGALAVKYPGAFAKLDTVP